MFDTGKAQTALFWSIVVGSFLCAVAAIGDTVDWWELTEGQKLFCTILGIPWIAAAAVVGIVFMFFHLVLKLLGLA